MSEEYFDKYLFEGDPSPLRRVVARMAPLVPAKTDLLGGLELGGIPLVTLLSQETGLPALFVRKAAKEYTGPDGSTKAAAPWTGAWSWTRGSLWSPC